MTTYQLVDTTVTGGAVVIHRLHDNAFIPGDEGNPDYQAYLSWVDAGNVPLPPDAEADESV